MLHIVTVAFQRFQEMMTINSPIRGGSPYIQAKLITARLCLVEDDDEAREIIAKYCKSGIKP